MENNISSNRDNLVALTISNKQKKHKKISNFEKRRN